MRLKKFNVIFSFIFLIISTTFGNYPYYFNHLNTKEGLTQSTILSITQDKHGFIWIGTMDGLNSFDGYALKIFRKQYNRANGLLNNRINALLADEDGSIWVGTDQGLHRFDPATEFFQAFTLKNIDHFIITQIKTLDEQHLLLCSNIGLYLFNKSNHRFSKVCRNKTCKIKRAITGEIIVGNQNGFFQFVNNTLNPIWQNSIKYTVLKDFFPESDSLLWVLTSKQFLKINVRSNKFIDLSKKLKKETGIPVDEFSAILPGPMDSFWIASKNGLFIYDRPNQYFQLCRQGEDGGLNSSYLTVLFKDREGVFWVGTYDNGLNYTDPKRNIFHNIIFKPNGLSLSNSLVFSIYKDHKKRLWIGTDNGLDVLNLRSDKIMHLKSKKIKNSLSNNRIRKIMSDHAGNIWIGTYDGLDKINAKTMAVKTYRPYPNSRQKNIILALFENSDGKIWVGLKRNGLFLFDPLKEKFETPNVFVPSIKSSQQLFVTDFGQDNNGNLFIATYGHSLLRYDKKEKIIKSVFNDSSKIKKICSEIYSIFFDKEGNIWLGTYGQGLAIYNFHRQKAIYLNDQNGLPDDVVYGILPDSQGQFWVSTNKGLCRINFKKMEEGNKNAIQVFDSRDGLQADEFNFGAYFKGQDENLYFGGIHGLTYFNPADFKKNEVPPEPVITKIKINNRDWREIKEENQPMAISLIKNLKLRHDQNSIYIGFSAPHFSNPSGNRFAYKLEGLEQTWNYTDASMRFVDYKNLKSGQYRFLLKASNADGIWSPNPTQLSITIQKTIWEYGWFKVLLILILGILFYELHRFLSIQITRKNKILKELNKNLKAENAAKINALKALKESIEKFEIIFNNAPVGVFYIDKEGRITECNKNFISLLGVTTKEVIGFNILEKIKNPSILDALHNALKKGSGYYEGINDATRKKRRVRAHINGIHDIDGKIIGAVGIVKDLSSEYEEQLRDSIIQHIVHAVHTTEDLPSFYKIFEKQISRAIPTKNLFFALYDEQKKMFKIPWILDEKDFAKELPVEGTLSYYVIRQKKAILLNTKKIRELVEKKEIKIVGTPAKCWLGVPLFIGNKPIGVLALQDYEDEHAFGEHSLQFLGVLGTQLAIAIQQKQDREVIRLLTQGIENSSLTIIIADKNGEIFYSNLNQYGFNLNNEPMSLEEILCYQVKDQAKNIRDSLRKGSRWSGEIRRIFADNKERWEFLSINPIYDAVNHVTHFVIVSEDITETKHLQNQLSQAQKIESIGTLAGGIAHDFNNLLTVINGHAEMALMKLNRNEKIHQDIISILHAGKKAAGLTRQLLAFSRKQMFNAEIINLNEVITNMDKMLRRLIGEDITIILELAPNLPFIKADPSQIEQVLLNLIVNARDAIREWQTKGKKHEKLIRIKTGKEKIGKKSFPFIDVTEGMYVQLSVQDSGIGMSDEIKEKVFEPFFTTKEVGKGTGLGLSTVYGIIKQNAGYIDVQSVEGQGSAFTVYWPMADLKAHRPMNAAEEGVVPKGKETILVVEDDETVRSFVRDVLLQSGYRVFEARNGKEASDILEKIPEPIDLVISDMVMPEMNGSELGVQIRQKYPDVKILFTSGYTESRIILNGEMSRTMNFLHKPFTITELTSTVRKMLETNKASDHD